MCGIAGILNLRNEPIARLSALLDVADRQLAHRGPDGHDVWIPENQVIGLLHRRLAIIDLSASGRQPMAAPNGTVITYNGEIYNYMELREELAPHWNFRSTSDTEVILAAYERWGAGCLDRLRGMFAFALWDSRKQELFCARDRFGIKPFYYCEENGVFSFASEAKALLPLVREIATDSDALAEYLTFQYTIGEKTLFRGIYQLLPGHMLRVQNGKVHVSRYWDVHHNVDWFKNERYFAERLRELFNDSVGLHLRSDVPVGAYISGGIDSSLVAISAAAMQDRNRLGFNGRFTQFPGYDESSYAKLAAARANMELHVADITATDFRDHFSKVIWHLDFPVAGPGAFPQYMVSALAAKHVKVVLGGQAGDEMFGGYARYLIAYFEQCIKAAIEGTYKNGNYVVTIESIVPNLGLLREYKPMMREFWREGVFDEIDARYFRLVDRSSDMMDEVDWSILDKKRVFSAFRDIFNNSKNVRHEAYFDKMTHFDFKCLLPALLHVEDRMSMAHGLESRVPFLDHPLVEFAATVPANIKFAGGDTKHLLKKTFSDMLPSEIVNRRDKMGFPVPLKEWFSGELKDFVSDIFSSRAAKTRPFFNADAVLANFQKGGHFSRKIWGLMSLEIWHQTFHDQASQIQSAARAVR
jgi:asparagine synthase (glutamine-hydrolysing)